MNQTLDRVHDDGSLTAPVIHQDHPKDVFMGPVDGDGLPQSVSSTNEERLNRKHQAAVTAALLLDGVQMDRRTHHLQLKVQLLTGSEHRRLC